jgi:uncharacterized protein
MTMTRERTAAIVPSVKFTLENSGSANLVRGYSASEIRIGEQVVRDSCIVTADRLLTDWGVREFAAFGEADLPAILALSPELVIVGSGATQQFAPAALRRAFATRGIGLEVMQLGAACRTYNVLVQEERKVAAVLFVR